jgi:hypothetical protein
VLFPDLSEAIKVMGHLPKVRGLDKEFHMLAKK